MGLVLLVRHAVTDGTGRRLMGRTPSIHLSDRGREQASHLAGRLGRVPLAAVYASPLERCVETAEAITAGRRITVQLEPGLNEVDYGRWTGRSVARAAGAGLWKQVQHHPGSVRFPGGESLGETQRRSVAAVDGAAERHRRRVVALVTHGDVIRLALAHYAGVHIDLFQRIVVGPASVSAVMLDGGIPRILRVNDTGDFDDLVRPSKRPTSTARAGRGPARGTSSRPAIRSGDGGRPPSPDA
jgi:probable phosphomutase (TIGR03848 family)